MEVLFGGIAAFLVLLGTALVLWVINYYKWLNNPDTSYEELKKAFDASRAIDENNEYIYKDFEDYLSVLFKEDE